MRAEVRLPCQRHGCLVDNCNRRRGLGVDRLRQFAPLEPGPAHGSARRPSHPHRLGGAPGCLRDGGRLLAARCPTGRPPPSRRAAGGTQGREVHPCAPRTSRPSSCWSTTSRSPPMRSSSGLRFSRSSRRRRAGPEGQSRGALGADRQGPEDQRAPADPFPGEECQVDARRRSWCKRSSSRNCREHARAAQAGGPTPCCRSSERKRRRS